MGSKPSFMDVDFGRKGSGEGGESGLIPEVFVKNGEDGNEFIFLSEIEGSTDDPKVPPITLFDIYEGESWRDKYAYEEGDEDYHPNFDPTVDDLRRVSVAYVFNLSAYNAIVLGEPENPVEEAYAEDKFLSSMDDFTGLCRFEMSARVSKDLQTTIRKLMRKAEKAGKKFSLKDYVIVVRKTGSGKDDTSYAVYESGTRFSDLPEELRKHIKSVAIPEGGLPPLEESHVAKKKYGAKMKAKKKREDNQKKKSKGESEDKPRRSEPKPEVERPDPTPISQENEEVDRDDKFKDYDWDEE